MNISFRLVFATLLAALFSFAARSGERLPRGSVVFDWFEYEGKDEIFDAPLEPGQYQNPILAGFYPDPSICRVGETFYMVTSSFSFFPGIPIFASADLVNWKQLGHVLDRPSQLELDGLEVSQGVFAPSIRYHDGVFYVINTIVHGIGNFYVTATDPAGPWSDPIELPFIDGIDPSFFFDDDGRVYITHNGPPPNGDSLYAGHRAVWLWEIDLETNEPIGEGRIIVNGGVDLSQEPVWIEAPHLKKKDGLYFLTCAEGGTSANHSQVVFRTKSLETPFVPWDGNPILTQRDLPENRANPIAASGHADFVQLANGDWWSVFLAVRPYEEGYYTTGRETYLLPMEWPESGWPMILEQGKEIPWRSDKPNAEASAKGAGAFTGNFSWRDDFDSPNLGYEWLYLRTPRGDWLTIDADAGHLRITPLSIPLGGKENPSWIARRQQHTSYEASANLKAPGLGVSAGIATLIREDHYYYAGVRDSGSGYEAFLEKAENGGPETVVSVPLLGLEFGDDLRLTVRADKAKISFFLKIEGAQEMAIAENEDATILTTNRAPGFVGTMIGPYARLEK